jgi:salicylate hydroxylase
MQEVVQRGEQAEAQSASIEHEKLILMSRRILIVGGGIGGLAAALACSSDGHEVELFERSAEFTEVGAGIQLGPNVLKVLYGWRLQEALAAVVAFPDRLQVRSATSGAELGVSRLGAVTVQRYGFPYATIHRADLHALLLAALQRQTTALLHVNSEVNAIEHNDEGVTLQTVDGLQVEGDVLIGADGLWSRVRQSILGDGAPSVTGHLAFRALVLQSSLPQRLRSQQVTAWIGPNLHVVQYPVRSGEWLNVVAIVHGRTQGDPSSWDHSTNASELRRNMMSTCQALQDLIHAIDFWRLWALSIRSPMRGPGEHAQGRVALLGDAAHPMVPYLAQGAGMAIEDAQALAGALQDKAGDVPVVLQNYANARWQRNARVQAGAIRNGEIFHATGLMRWGRDTAMKLLGERLLDLPWLYRGST